MGARIAGMCAVASLGGVVALVSRASGTATPVRGPLAPDPAALHYRYPIVAKVSEDLSGTIAALEARTSQPVASPMEMADLADMYLKRAQQTGDAADYARSEVVAERSLAMLRAPSGAPLTLAKLASARHEFRRAIALATEFLTHKRSAGALGVLAAAHLALGELPEAAQAAEWAVGVKPDSSAYLMRALVFQAEGRDAEAAFDFARAARVEDAGDPEEAARLRALWGRFLIRRGERAGAEQVLAEAVRIAPDYPLAVAQQAELALRTGHAADAKAKFEQAFVASHQVRYLIDEARAQQAAGDARGAASTRAVAEKLVRADLAASGLGHRLELVEILLDGGRKEALPEATALAREEMAARPSADTRYQMARALEAAGSSREALDVLRGALAQGVREARFFELAARLEAASGNAPRAEMYAAEAARL